MSNVKSFVDKVSGIKWDKMTTTNDASKAYNPLLMKIEPSNLKLVNLG